MQRFLLFVFLFCSLAPSAAQRPKNGTLTYNIAYWDWGGKPRGLQCQLLVIGDSVSVISTGVGENMGEKGTGRRPHCY